MAKEGRQRVTDMTEGTPIRLILWFAVPIFLGNIFQQFYNLVDTFIAGKYLGDDALAALGAISSVYSLIICFVWGFTNGYSILISRAFGEKNEERVRNSVGLMILLNLILMVVVTTVGLLGIGPLLKLLRTPDKIYGDALTYIIIIISGLFITIMYNMEAATLRALGNSRTPLVYLIVASVSNIILDLAFIVVLKMGVSGLAIATVAAQFISVVLCFLHIYRHYPILRLSRKNFRVRKEEVSEMFSTGLSMALMYSIFSMGTVILQSAINGLGTYTITAHLAARKTLEVLQLPISTISNANATFVSQNYGAGKMERVREGVKKSCLIGMTWSVIAAVLIMFTSEWIVRLLTSTEKIEVVRLAAQYLHINIPFLIVLTVLLILRTTLQGIGRKITPLISSGLELGVKVIATWMLIPVAGYFGVCIVEPIIWVICMIWLMISYQIAMRQYAVRKKLVHNKS